MATRNRNPENDTANRADARIQGLADAVASAATEAGTQFDQLASTAEAGLGQANAALRRRSDASLAILGAFSAGLAVGLLMGGANRLLVAAAMAPAALVAGIGLERIDRGSSAPGS